MCFATTWVTQYQFHPHVLLKSHPSKSLDPYLAGVPKVVGESAHDIVGGGGGRDAQVSGDEGRTAARVGGDLATRSTDVHVL